MRHESKSVVSCVWRPRRIRVLANRIWRRLHSLFPAVQVRTAGLSALPQPPGQPQRTALSGTANRAHRSESFRLNVYGVLSGAGISNNASTATTISSLTINQVLPPWLGDLQCLTNGGFQFGIYGNANHPYTLQISSNLLDWQTLASFTVTNSPSYFTDSSATNVPNRFYRGCSEIG
jgi:hypothetical protein